MKRNFLTTAGAVLACSGAAVAGISVTPTDDPATLVNKILGSGITVTSASFTGASGAAGTFKYTGASPIGISEGILITSGYASNVGDVNTSDAITGDNGLAGVSYLDALIPGYTTYDATVLDFTFKFDSGYAGDLYFNYVFGSDEYDEWVGSSYNDVFGFFLDGTAVGNNVALIPGTSTPVAINNVNASINSAYYNDNDPDIGSPFAFEYDGFTDVLYVKVTGLDTSVEHNIKLAIADAGDRVLDSGVFIEAGTFSPEPPPGIPDGGSSLGLALLGLLGLGFISRRGH